MRLREIGGAAGAAQAVDRRAVEASGGQHGVVQDRALDRRVAEVDNVEGPRIELVALLLMRFDHSEAWRWYPAGATS